MRSLKSTETAHVESSRRRSTDEMAKSTRAQSNTPHASQDATEKVRVAKALMPLVRLLARQAAGDALMASQIEQENRTHEED